MSKKSLQTPINRRSMLGLGSVSSKVTNTRKPPEQKHLTFSANKSRLQFSASSSRLTTNGIKRWSTQSSHQVKDSRPLSNRTYQKQMIEEILEFLNETGYPHQISTKSLSAPTTKEFLCVFEHLYSFINTEFKMPKKFEEEVPRILKSLNYPFLISKSAMFSIGSLHTWPPILGALQWMVETIRTANVVDVEQVLFPAPFVENDVSSQQEKFFFEYYRNTYREFMLGNDDFSEASEMVQTALIMQAGCSEDEHSALQDEVADLEQELADLEAEPDILEEALKIKAALEESMEQKLLKCSELDQESEVLNQQYQQLQIQIKEETGLACDKLGDPKRQEEMKHKSSEVKRHLERLNMEKERLEQQNNEREVRYSRLYDKSSQTVNQYNDIARELTLNPLISQHLGDNSITLQFDHNQKDLSTLMDCKQRLKPLLVKLAKGISEDNFQIESVKITCEEKLDQLTEMRIERECQLVQLKAELASIEKELESHKEVMELEYQTAMQKLREKEEFLDSEQKQINDILERESKQLEIKRKEVEDLRRQQKIEQDEAAFLLIKFCEDVKRYKHEIEERLKQFNTSLKDELQNYEKQKILIEEMCKLVRA